LANAPKFSHRRLQREKDFTGNPISSFREVFVRHGLPGLILALAVLAAPGFYEMFVDSLESGRAAPAHTAFISILIFLGLSVYAWRIDRRLSLSKLGWVAYLGLLSFWEEWVFRIAIPQTLEGFGVTVWMAAFVSAVLFGSVHYFTLRWKWQWCVGAFVGGLALSRQMELHDSLLLITAFHWVATTLNTPRPPGQNTNADRP